MRQVMTAPTMAMIAPTDRSMPLVPMTTAMPNATSAVGTARYRMSIRLPNSRPSTMRIWKNPGETIPSTAKISASATIGQTARWPEIARNLERGGTGAWMSAECFTILRPRSCR